MANRDYEHSDCPSVTQVLGVLRKIGLEVWFKNNTKEFCNEESRKGKEIGIQIHKAIQDHIEENKVKIETIYGEEVSNALNSFMQFKKDYPEIQLEKAELQLFSEQYKYNGTLDCLARVGKDVVLLDWKTSKCKEKTEPEIYPEYEYQVAAYVMAHNEMHKTQIKRAYVLVLAKDKVAYRIQIINQAILEELFKEVFLPALQIFNYQKRR